MDIKERLESARVRHAVATPSVPKPTSDPGPNNVWAFDEKTQGWVAKPKNDPKGFETMGNVIETLKYYNENEDSLLITAEWNPKDENKENWDAEIMRREVIAHIEQKHKAKKAEFIEFDWQTGLSIIKISNVKRPGVKVVFAELKAEEV